MFSMNYFATRRRNVHTMVSHVNSVHRFNAHEAQITSRKIGRLNDRSGQFLCFRTFASRRALSAQGLFN